MVQSCLISLFACHYYNSLSSYLSFTWVSISWAPTGGWRAIQNPYCLPMLLSWNSLQMWRGLSAHCAVCCPLCNWSSLAEKLYPVGGTQKHFSVEKFFLRLLMILMLQKLSTWCACMCGWIFMWLSSWWPLLVLESLFSVRLSAMVAWLITVSKSTPTDKHRYVVLNLSWWSPVQVLSKIVWFQWMSQWVSLGRHHKTLHERAEKGMGCEPCAALLILQLDSAITFSDHKRWSWADRQVIERGGKLHSLYFL
jgi:hypothetical protein